MTRAIFQNTRQAIAFSYMISSLPARDGGQLGKLLDRMKLEASGMQEVREASSISFAGLNEMEIRGQAAMVRAAVENLIAPPESWAIRSRYGVAYIQRGPERKILSASYGPDRTRSMRNLAGYLAPAFDTLTTDALLLLVARICGECDELRPTFRQIESEAGTSKSAAERAEKRMKSKIRELVNRGVDTLTPLFERDGLVACEETDLA